MNEPGMKVEIHLIQNFAPSNLNRDDTGQPKDCTFGGYRRARLSSQSEKRATRMWWKDKDPTTVGSRTKRLQGMLVDRLSDWRVLRKEGLDEDFLMDGQDEDFLREGVRVFTDAYYAGADKTRPEQTSVLVFVGQEEVEVCVQAVRELWADQTKPAEIKGGSDVGIREGISTIVTKRREFDKKNPKKLADADPSGDESDGNQGETADATIDNKNRPSLKVIESVVKRIREAKVSADVALFGRMLATQPGRNTDGSCQVAHAISTHKVDMEMDFYTAVDDLNSAEQTGAGMMGVVGFNSACYYRYALVDRDQLARNLSSKTEQKNGEWTQPLAASDYAAADGVIKSFLEAMVYAIPTGKQNSFAAQNLPSFGMFVVRKKGVPLSLANAFATPVKATKEDDDLIGLSVKMLSQHWDSLQSVYGKQGVVATPLFHVDQGKRLQALANSDKKSVVAAIEATIEALSS